MKKDVDDFVELSRKLMEARAVCLDVCGDSCKTTVEDEENGTADRRLGNTKKSLVTDHQPRLLLLIRSRVGPVLTQ